MTTMLQLCTARDNKMTLTVRHEPIQMFKKMNKKMCILELTKWVSLVNVY